MEINSKETPNAFSIWSISFEKSLADHLFPKDHVSLIISQNNQILSPPRKRVGRTGNIVRTLLLPSWDFDRSNGAGFHQDRLDITGGILFNFMKDSEDIS